MVALATILVALLTSCSATATPAAQGPTAGPTPAPGSGRRIGLDAFRVAPLSDLSPDAVAYLEGRGGRVGVAVLVPSRAQIYTNAARGDGFHAASVIKVLIMMTFLRQAQDEGRELSPDEMVLLQQMITVSDNDAADVLWSDLGGAEGVEAFLHTVGLSGIEPDSEGHWGASLATPVAMAELYYLLASGQALGPQQTQTAVDLLAQVDPTQRWGVTAGTGKDPTSQAMIRIKDGWYPDDSGWWVNSIGLVTTGDAKPAYTIAVMSDQQPTMEDGQATIEGVSVRVHVRD